MPKYPQKLCYLNHKENTYKGNSYESFVGSFTDGNHTYLISINAQSGEPQMSENNKDGKPLMFANVTKLPKQTKKRNEF